MMKRSFLFIVFLGASVVVLAQTELSLNKAIEYALDNNLNVKVAENLVEIAENNATRGNAGGLPSVTAGAGANGSLTNTTMIFAGNAQPPIERNGAHTRTISGNLSASYTLFNGFLATNTYSKLELQNELANTQSKLQIEGILLSVINAYLNTLQMQGNLTAAEKSLQISMRRHERAQLRVEFGSANRIALLNAKVDLKNDSITVMTLSQNLSNAKNNLIYLMGTDPGDFVLSDDFEIGSFESYEEILDKALEQNLSVLQARKNMEVSEADMSISKASLYPSLSVSTGYSYSRNSSDASFIINNNSNGLNGAVNLSYNLFNGGKSAIARENSTVLWENNQLRYEDIKRSLQTQINNAYTTYQNNLAVYNLRKSSLKANQLNFERSEEMFKNGQITGTEFREAQLNLTNAEVQLYLARISVKLSEYELLRLSGQLVN
ncbi:hypothetical protein GC194_05385 [bacterium]|nr:hypothetical protein [bacterium]